MSEGALYLVSSSELPALSVAGASGRRVVRLSQYYDAAATTRDNDWGLGVGVQFEDHLFAGPTRALVLARFRREVRNNPYLSGLVNKYPEAIGNTSLRSRTSSRSYNDAKEFFWFRYSKRCTAAGDSLRSTERIVMQELLVAGEIFVVLLANGRVQLVPSEFCGSGVAVARSVRKNEINGIVYSDRGVPQAYRFGKLTPSGSIAFTGNDDELVPARDVIHVFDRDRVMMGRGLPWLLPSLKTARDLYEICRAKTKQIKDANSITGFLEKEGAAEYLNAFSTSTTSADNTVTPADPDSPAVAQPTTPNTMELHTGTLIGLEPGEKANILSTQYHASDYKELIMLMLHAISAPVGLPVELWFSGLGDVNYSGFKGLGVQWNGRRRYVIKFLEDRLFDRWHFWRVSKAQREGDLIANPDGDEDLIEWGWRRTAVLDDEKSARANQARLDSGEISLADVWEENGLFAEEVLLARRQLYIKALVAAGDLEEGADHSTVKVPVEFLLGRPVKPASSQSTAKKPADEEKEDEEPEADETDDSEDQEEEETVEARRVVEWRPSDFAALQKQVADTAIESVRDARRRNKL